MATLPGFSTSRRDQQGFFLAGTREREGLRQQKGDRGATEGQRQKRTERKSKRVMLQVLEINLTKLSLRFVLEDISF